MNTKLHAVTDAHGRPLSFFITAGQISYCTGPAALLDDLPKAQWMLADRGYDAEGFRDALEQKGIKPCIPGRKSLSMPPGILPEIDPDGIDHLFAYRRYQLFGPLPEGGSYPTIRQTDAGASDSEIEVVARPYGVPASALLAIADLEGRRSRWWVESNAHRLKRRLREGKSLGEVVASHVIRRHGRD